MLVTGVDPVFWTTNDLVADAPGVKLPIPALRNGLLCPGDTSIFKTPTEIDWLVLFRPTVEDRLFVVLVLSVMLFELSTSPLELPVVPVPLNALEMNR